MLLADFRYIFFVLDLLDKLRSCWDVEKLNLNSGCLNISKKQMSKYTIDPSSHHISPSIKHPLPWQLSLLLLPKYKVDVTQHHFCHKAKRTGGGPCLLSGVGSTCKGFSAHRLQQETRKGFSDNINCCTSATGPKGSFGCHPQISWDFPVSRT